MRTWHLMPYDDGKGFVARYREELEDGSLVHSVREVPRGVAFLGIPHEDISRTGAVVEEYEAGLGRIVEE